MAKPYLKLEFEDEKPNDAYCLELIKRIIEYDYQYWGFTKLKATMENG